MVVSAAVCQWYLSSLLICHQPLGLSPASLPEQGMMGQERLKLDNKLHQPSTTAVQLLGRGVLRDQSHKQSPYIRRMRKRGEAAIRNQPASLFGGSCFMSKEQTSWLPAAGIGRRKGHGFSPAIGVGHNEEMIKWQELRTR